MAKARNFFEQVVIPYTGDDCLLWPYARQKGHACIKVPNEKKVVRVCTLLCEMQYGPKPTPQHEVRHHCGKGHLGCVTNGHVSWSTHIDNKADELIHGTRNHGPRNGRWGGLTKAQVKAIRLSTDPQRVIAERYGISQQHVSDIVRGKKWKHI